MSTGATEKSPYDSQGEFARHSPQRVLAMKRGSWGKFDSCIHRQLIIAKTDVISRVEKMEVTSPELKKKKNSGFWWEWTNAFTTPAWRSTNLAKKLQGTLCHHWDVFSNMNWSTCINHPKIHPTSVPAKALSTSEIAKGRVTEWGA